MKFGAAFISWIKLFYTSPRASICINGSTSHTFNISRGTRQGCPMSPLLFALTIEPLAALIRSHPEVRGFKRGHMEEKIALYSDDLLLFLEDASASLDEAVTVIETFGKYSGLTINFSICPTKCGTSPNLI